MKFVKPTTIVLGISLALPACQMNTGGGLANSTPTQSLTAQEKQLRQQRETFNKTVVQGAAVGAMFGAILGGVTGDSGEDVLKGAAIGGAMGAASGYYIAGRQSQFATAEDQLNEVIAITRQRNGELDQVLATQRSVIENDRTRLATLQLQVAEGEASRADLTAAVQSARANREAMADISGDLDGESQKLSQNVAVAYNSSPAGAARLQNEVLTFQSKQNAFNASLQEYDQLIDSIDIGEV